MGRRFAGAGLYRRGGREPGIPTPNLEGLGSSLLYHWEVPQASSPLITLNGGNISQLNDRVGSAHLVQATAGLQPEYQAAGGPNSQPCAVLQDVGRELAATISIAAANRAGFYAVAKSSATNSRTIFNTQNAAETLSPVAIFRGTDAFNINMFFTGGAQNHILITPAIDTNWHLVATRPIASGALIQMDGTTTDPTCTGNDTMIDWGLVRWGLSSSATSGGSIAFAVLVSDPTAGKDEIIKAYVRSRYKLVLA